MGGAGSKTAPPVGQPSAPRRRLDSDEFTVSWPALLENCMTPLLMDAALGTPNVFVAYIRICATVANVPDTPSQRSRAPPRPQHAIVDRAG